MPPVLLILPVKVAIAFSGGFPGGLRKGLPTQAARRITGTLDGSSV